MRVNTLTESFFEVTRRMHLLLNHLFIYNLTKPTCYLPNIRMKRSWSLPSDSPAIAAITEENTRLFMAVINDSCHVLSKQLHPARDHKYSFRNRPHRYVTPKDDVAQRSLFCSSSLTEDRWGLLNKPIRHVVCASALGRSIALCN